MLYKNTVQSIASRPPPLNRVFTSCCSVSNLPNLSINGADMRFPVAFLFAATLGLAATSVRAECRGYSGPDGACYSGPGGGLYTGPGGGAYTGPGGGLYTGPGGGLYTGPGGGMYTGPGGGLYTGPGGGMYTGPGGGIYTGPTSPDGYKGPWGPCITGVLGDEWQKKHCPR